MKNLLRIGMVTSFFMGLTSCTFPNSKYSIYQEIAKEQKLEELLTISTRHMNLANEESLKQAKAILELAYELDPNDPRVLDGFGCLALRQGDIYEAENYFSQTIQINSNYDRGYAHLAYVAEDKGDYKSAIQLLQAALALNPMNLEARNNYATLLLKHPVDGFSKEEATNEMLKASHIAKGLNNIVSSNLKQIFLTGYSLK